MTNSTSVTQVEFTHNSSPGALFVFKATEKGLTVSCYSHCKNEECQDCNGYSLPIVIPWTFFDTWKSFVIPKEGTSND